ncbi:MAG: hypothetical protein HQM08_08110 [Candidatus Riflebacteria bacterium]|nr:hypothetical protein [Candidatus Riflebacteria bacterium]
MELETFGKKAVTLVEILVVALILGVLLAMMTNFFRFFFGRSVTQVSQKLALQMEARRGLVNIFSEIQEGIELMQPSPGQTLPYLVLRDYVNNLHFIFQKKCPSVSDRSKTDIYNLYSSIHDIEKSATSQPKEILRNVERLTFTAHGYNGVVVTATLRDGTSTFSFVNLVRLKNALTDDSL